MAPRPKASNPGLRALSAPAFVALLLLAALFLRFFRELSHVFLLIYASAVLAVALNAVARRLPLGRKWAAAAIGLVLLTILAVALWFGGSLLLDQLQDFLEEWPQIRAQIESWAESVRQRTGLQVGRIVEQIGSTVGSAGGLLGRAQSLVGALVLPLVILFGGLFALAQPNDRLLEPLLRAIPHRHRDPVRRAFQLLGKRLLGWVQGQLLAMLAVGILATVAFTAIGVPYALLLGVVNGLTEFIPLAGPWLGGIPAVVVAAVDDPTKGLWTAGAVTLIQWIENSVVTPLAMADRAKVHPFVTLFALVLFGTLFGFLGILLAVPLVLLIWTAAEVFWVEEKLGSEDEEIPDVVRE